MALIGLLALVAQIACESSDGTAELGLASAAPGTESSAGGDLVHPGRITLVDLDTEEIRELTLDELPEGIRWEQVKGQRIPVVRIESRSMGSGREIIKYGSDGQLLSVTRGGSPRKMGASP